jgi:predicted TIM-barrel fold metal-dependent hydrolase
MGNLGAAREIPGLSRLDENDQEKILLDNAKQFFRL